MTGTNPPRDAGSAYGRDMDLVDAHYCYEFPRVPYNTWTRSKPWIGSSLVTLKP